MKSLSITLIISVALVVVAQFFLLPLNTITLEGAEASDNDTTKTTPSRITVTVYKDNWFDFVNEYFEKYTTAKVIDVDTLKSYTVKRVGGYNHADVEPITATDTSIFYSIYGNEWSWTRRPVWVLYNGRYMAGSINGYPHSYDLVEGNNMTGHSCIHFYMSRTHGANNLDPAHQTAVSTAYNSEDKLSDYLNR